MIAGLSGSLLSHDAVDRLVRPGPNALLAREDARAARQALRSWHGAVKDVLGPSCGARRVFDLVAEPLASSLGFTVVPVGGGPGTIDALLQVRGVGAAALIATAWGQPGGVAWRHAIHRGLAHESRWCLCVNGPAVRVIDVERAYARRHAEFDIALVLEDEQSFSVFWGLLHSSAFAPGSAGALLDRVAALCERHRTEVRASLRNGVHDALLTLIAAFRTASRRQAEPRLLNESLVVVYRILFLLFAEARGLVPRWHPVYRTSYTVEALCEELGRAPVGRGIWEALQAIARLAHRGCRAGALRVPPFNGRLFSPADAPLAESVPLDDRAVGQALVALTTRRSKESREHISYGDLGVEQLGGVYEHLLDFDLAAGARGGPVVLLPTGRRKATGSFYTPRSLTDFLVRRALAPMVQGATPDAILRLRVLDPAMGSGAFLVAACRYLAAAYEQALIQEGMLSPGDMDDGDRTGFRRAIAQRCLYGVDANPMAVQLGRLSLWLATLAADRPLTFLDHHLRTGNSLVGGSIEAIMRQPAPGGKRPRPRELPLFPGDDLQSSLESIVTARTRMAHTPDDTLEQVRGKEKALASVSGPDGPVDRWKAAADLWCAAWFVPRSEAPGRATFRSLLDLVVLKAGALPEHVAASLLSRARQLAAAERFFHWTFEFPEVFYDQRGAPLPDAGFDAVVGNPPWDMLREGQGGGRTGELSRFARGSGLYALQGAGHGNLYQLFLERVLQLLRPGGRAGLILPSGFASDQSSALLRRHLFDRTSIDTFTILENREGLFPIHRGLKFLLITLENAGATTELRLRTGVRAAEALDSVPDAGAPRGTVAVPRVLVERLSGEGLAVPDIRNACDLTISSQIAFGVPVSADPAGWGIRFGRELNLTDDRPHFTPGGPGLPVLEGKQLRPFAVDAGACRYRIPARTAGRLLNADATFHRARLAYRDVAASSNRTTLIAAIVPAGVVTAHTVFCLKDRLDEEAQQFLCGVFNSYVANYLVRMRVSTHVTTAIIARLPLPRPEPGDAAYSEIAAISRSLARGPDDRALARLHALVALQYGLSQPHFAHVLDTFPLVPRPERSAALRAFEAAKGPAGEF